jgi:hypothetical protein
MKNRNFFLAFKAGFWGSFGFICGISSVIAIIFIAITLYSSFEGIKSKVDYEWKRLWYSKEEKQFDDCFQKEYQYMDSLSDSRVGIDFDERPERYKYLEGGSPIERCVRKGLKPFGSYLID